jgi:hypothetical protein
MRVKSNHAANVTLCRYTGTLEEGQTGASWLIEEVTLGPGQEADVHEGFLSTSGAASLLAEGIIERVGEPKAETDAKSKSKGGEK